MVRHSVKAYQTWIVRLCLPTLIPEVTEARKGN